MRYAALLVLLPVLLLAACRSRLAVPGMRIEGNENLLDSDLVEAGERYLRRFLENDRRPADADDAAYAMQTAYREEGYAEARVTFTLEDGDLVFHVNEGPRAELGRVRFEGVKSLKVADLERFFDFDGSGFLSLGPVLVVPEEVAAAVSSVETAYHEAGFLHVEVADPELSWNTERTKADVVVRVEEGHRYTVAALTVDGASRSLVGAPDPVGRPYRSTLPAVLASRVRKRLRDLGYAFAEVKGSAEVDDETATARIHLEVEPGEPTRLGDVRVSGNRVTKTGFLRRRFPLRPGDVIRRDRLERGIADLYRSRLFDSVQADVVATTPGWADLVVDVAEADTKRLDLEAGWGSWNLLYGSVGYKDFNLFGQGRILRAQVLASVRTWGGEVQLEDPWVLGRDSRLWIAGGAVQREDRFYDYTAFHVEAAAERRFDRHRRLWGGYRFSLEQATNLSASIPPDELEAIDGFQRSAGPYLRYRHDHRDDLFIPTEGWVAEVSGLWSTPVLGASLSYVQLEFAGSYYVNLGAWGVLALGADLGTRAPYDGTTMPIQQRYFLGGQQSVRSFGQDELTPTDAFGKGIGGLTYAEIGVEWRRRIVDILHGAIFFDAGQVSEDSWSLDGEVGYGVGAGLRVYTPVGPVRVDGAYNPGPLLGASRRWQLHVSFGFSF